MAYDYKQLCGELLNHLYQCDWPDGERFYVLVERTRDALAEPEPEGPTDQELAELYRKSYYKCENRQGDAAQVFALRAVLARWGK